MLGRKIIRKLGNWCNRLFVTPIEVFVFHGVSDVFDEREYQKIDWMSTGDFQRNIHYLLNNYTFISLPEAYSKLKKNWLRCRKYAVLTCDDGFADVLKVLPYLNEKNIPITLFVNPKYLDGISRREGYSENPRYITYEELFDIQFDNVTIGFHGYEHVDVTKQSREEFRHDLQMCIDSLTHHTRYIPYYAYTWGRFNDDSQRVLNSNGIIPVLTDGLVNYHYSNGISRRLLDANSFVM